MGAPGTLDKRKTQMTFQVVTKVANTGNRCHARIKGANGEIIFSSQNYTTKESAKTCV
jgi:uncharacterized protein YegP (UPF0339 family)